MADLSLIEYQDAWPLQFAGVAAELRTIFTAPRFALEHIGSTAVPGLCAKPVFDVVLGAAALHEVEAQIPALARHDFAYRPEYEVQIPGRRYFVRAAGATLRVHLHAVVVGGPLWGEHLRFRDALRGDAALMQSYAALKRYLAVLHAADKTAYTEAKAPFIRQVLAEQDAR